MQNLETLSDLAKYELKVYGILGRDFKDCVRYSSMHLVEERARKLS